MTLKKSVAVVQTYLITKKSLQPKWYKRLWFSRKGHLLLRLSWCKVVAMAFIRIITINRLRAKTLTHPCFAAIDLVSVPIWCSSIPQMSSNWQLTIYICHRSTLKAPYLATSASQWSSHRHQQGPTPCKAKYTAKESNISTVMLLQMAVLGSLLQLIKSLIEKYKTRTSSIERRGEHKVRHGTVHSTLWLLLTTD